MKNNKIVRLLEWPVTILLCIVFMVGTYVWDSKVSSEKKREYQKLYDAEYKNIIFSGTVCSIHRLHKNGREEDLLCIAIDSSSVDYYYHYDHYSFLKIANGVATFAETGELYGILCKTSYVKVNPNHNEKIEFYDKNGDKIHTTPLCYVVSNISVVRLEMCDSCTTAVSAQ